MKSYDIPKFYTIWSFSQTNPRLEDIFITISRCELEGFEFEGFVACHV